MNSKSTGRRTSPKKVALKVDLPGLVAIFGDSLYEDFGSVVRELTQNAHDAIIERCSSLPDPEEQLRDHAVSILFDAARRSLVVADNGGGMDAETISRSLNNFAKSKKQGLESAISDRASTEAARRLLHIVGEYGVGFLSAMAVSTQVDVWTRTESSGPVLWTYHASEAAAQLQEMSADGFSAVLEAHSLKDYPTGTVVVCQLQEKVLEEYLLDEDALRESIIRFASLLPVPIQYNGESISCKYAAWENPAAATEEDWKEAIQGMYGVEPLLVIPVFSPAEELDLQGVLWIPERTYYFSTPELDIYIKRMFVVRDDDVVMPTWARFVAGMVNSNRMRRIVSGNTVRNDKTARMTREFLKSRIIDEFHKLRGRSEHEYWRIVAPHDDAIKGSAADDEEFRSCVWDKLRFPCRDRKLTIPEYLSLMKRKIESENVIYFYGDKKQQHSADLVAEATGVPILNLDQTRDDVLVRMLCTDMNYELRSFRELAEEHFQKPEDDEPFTSLVAACAHWNIDAEVRDYSPHHLPAVLIEDQTFQERRDQLLKGLKEHGEEHFAKDLEALFRKQHAANFGVSFYLNSTNALIQALARAEPEDQSRMCLALYNISFMAAVPALRDSERRKVYEAICGVFLSALEKSNATARSRSPQRETRSERAAEASHTEGPVTLFMIAPFAEEYRKIEVAVRQVFEGPPYFFHVLLARDFTYHSSLLKNVQTHIAKAHAFIAEISDLNPNVMLELGAVLLAGSQKPVFSLRGREARKEVPADLKSELYVPYGSLSDSGEILERDIRAAFERDGRPSHSGITALLEKRTRKALTRTLLEGLSIRLNSSEIDAILGQFDTIESFLRTDGAGVVKQTPLKKYVVDALRAELHEMCR